MSEVTDAELADSQRMGIGVPDSGWGVVLCRDPRRHAPRVNFGGESHYLGTYKTFEEAKLVAQKVKCRLRGEGETPEMHRHGVSPAPGVTIRGVPNFGEGELDRPFSLKRDNKARSSVPHTGVYCHGQRCYAEITVPGQQCDSGSDKEHSGIHDTALQAAQVRQKVKTVLEQRGDLTLAGVSPEHGIDIRGLKDFKPESLLLSTNRNGPKTKRHSKCKCIQVIGGGRVHECK